MKMTMVNIPDNFYVKGEFSMKLSSLLVSRSRLTLNECVLVVMIMLTTE